MSGGAENRPQLSRGGPVRRRRWDLVAWDAPGAPISESEFGRLYVLTISQGGVQTLVLHLPAP
jgi:hypothetical protein